MQKALLLAFMMSAGNCLAETNQSLALRFEAQGRLLLSAFENAPFPHASRNAGYRYKEQFFDATNHYSDTTVAVFVPKGFRETGQVDLVVHFHGWQNNVARVLEKYQLIEQLIASGRNAVLVVPQGPRNASDSGGGKLEESGGFARLIQEVRQKLAESGAVKKKDFKIGRVIISGHSGGYKVMSFIVERGGLPEPPREVWLFDALYAETDKFLDWAGRCPQGRLLNIYTDHGGTKDETERMMAALQRQGTPFIKAEDTEIKPAMLDGAHLVFLHTGLAHDDVLDKHQTFRRFLETSCLEPR
jgi:hypothetical protein